MLPEQNGTHRQRIPASFRPELPGGGEEAHQLKNQIAAVDQLSLVWALFSDVENQAF